MESTIGWVDTQGYFSVEWFSLCRITKDFYTFRAAWSTFRAVVDSGCDATFWVCGRREWYAKAHRAPRTLPVNLARYPFVDDFDAETRAKWFAAEMGEASDSERAYNEGVFPPSLAKHGIIANPRERCPESVIGSYIPWYRLPDARLLAHDELRKGSPEQIQELEEAKRLRHQARVLGLKLPSLPRGVMHRIETCSTALAPVDIVGPGKVVRTRRVSRETGLPVEDAKWRSSVRNLIRCGHRACPVCSQIKAGEVCDDLTGLFRAIDLRGCKRVHMTLTIRHRKWNSLAEMLGVLRTAFSAFGRSFSPVVKRLGGGYCRAFDYTYSEESGHHPHFHVVVWWDGEHRVDTSQWARHWQEAVEAVNPVYKPTLKRNDTGQPVGCVITSGSDASDAAAYLAGAGKKMAMEMSLSETKLNSLGLTQLLDLPDLHPVWVEAVRALDKYKWSWVTWGQGSKRQLKEWKEEAVACGCVSESYFEPDEVEEVQVVCEITQEALNWMNVEMDREATFMPRFLFACEGGPKSGRAFWYEYWAHRGVTNPPRVYWEGLSDTRKRTTPLPIRNGPAMVVGP